MDPDRLKSHEVTLHEVFDALAQNNQNAGAATLRKTIKPISFGLRAFWVRWRRSVIS